MKPLLKSKTIAVNAVIIAASLIPGVGDWVQSHPAETLTLLGAVNIILRLVTKEKLSLWGSES